MELKLPPHLETYSQDGRLPIQILYQKFSSLSTNYDWLLDIIHQQPVVSPNPNGFRKSGLKLPILCLRTPQPGPALWLLSGIHGEEPTGPNAMAQNIKFLEKLANLNIPIVLLPLLNPAGYICNWRYPNEYRDHTTGLSVSDAEHVLPHPKHQDKPRLSRPSSPTAQNIIAYVLKKVKSYPPLLTVDLHEDELLAKSYIYVSGQHPAKTQIAKLIISLLSSQIPLQMSGKTRFGETIKNAIVKNEGDGSIDELLAAPHIILKRQILPGPAALATFVIETPTINIPLPKRIAAHTHILRHLRELWQQVAKL